MDVRRRHNGQQRILQRVALEDIGERRADHGAKAELRQRPGRVLAGTATAEIVACQQNVRTLGLRLAQDEIRYWIALLVVTPIAERLLVEAERGDRLQER